MRTMLTFSNTAANGYGAHLLTELLTGKTDYLVGGKTIKRLIGLAINLTTPAGYIGLQWGLKLQAVISPELMKLPVKLLTFGVEIPDGETLTIVDMTNANQGDLALTALIET